MRRAFVFALATPLVGICFAQSAPPAAGAAAKASNQRDRMICRRFVRVGSLVDGYRVCKTRDEWNREHENLQHLDNPNSCNSPQGLGCDRFN